ncbi:MAG TPA: Hsp20 family protein [Bryobacteraceae bacterium]|nr:Hsp20 family protein [Bryobacteraceae bacterium]
MSQIAITRVRDEKESPSVLEDLKALAARVRDRAFAIFEKRGAGGGKDLDDWLEAERELILSTESELSEKDSRFELSIAVPGFAPKDLEVTALPDALIVRGESAQERKSKEGNVEFREEKQLLRRFDLPGEIDVDKVSADLEKGVLHVTAAKAAAAGEAWGATA